MMEVRSLPMAAKHSDSAASQSASTSGLVLQDILALAAAAGPCNTQGRQRPLWDCKAVSEWGSCLVLQYSAQAARQIRVWGVLVPTMFNFCIRVACLGIYVAVFPNCEALPGVESKCNWTPAAAQAWRPHRYGKRISGALFWEGVGGYRN